MMRRLFILALLIATTAPLGAQAASSSWNYIVPFQLAYHAVIATNSWSPGLAPNANVTITYVADVIDAATGSVIAPGGTVSVGQQLTLKFKAFESTDIYWFGTGQGSDSPYGAWDAGAVGPPVTPSGQQAGTYIGTCEADDFVGRGQTCSGGGKIELSCASWDIYIPLSVQPPTRSISGLSGLTCGALQPNGAMQCTVASAGAINPSFNYAATYGRFWYNYIGGAASWVTGESSGSGACWAGDHLPMRQATGAQTTTNDGFPVVPVAGGDYILNVPARSISYPLVAVVPNTPPNPPVITGPTSGLRATNHQFGFQATDPNGDPIRYGIDWNLDAVVDEWLPAVGTTPSGTQLFTPHSWPTSGGKTFQARTVDTSLSVSSWTSYTINLTEPVDLRAGGITPTTALAGVGQNFSATITNYGTQAAGAHTTLFQTANDASGTGAANVGTVAVGSVAGGNGTATSVLGYTFPSAGTYYMRACADLPPLWAGSIIETDDTNNCGAWTAITVSPATPVATLTATPNPVTVNNTATLNYSCSNSTSATLSTFGSVTPVGGGSRTTPALTSDTNYQLTCTGPGGTDNDTVTVAVTIPTIDISAAPERIPSGGSVGVTWTSNLCTSVSITKNGAVFSSAPNATNISSGPITTQTTFRASCDGNAAVDTVIVNIIPAFEEF